MYQQYSTFSNFSALHAKVQHNNTDCDYNRPENCSHLVTIGIEAIDFCVKKRVEKPSFYYLKERKFLRSKNKERYIYI